MRSAFWQSFRGPFRAAFMVTRKRDQARVSPRRTALDTLKACRGQPGRHEMPRRIGVRSSRGWHLPPRGAACSKHPASTGRHRGQVAEWLNAPHSKCGIPARVSGVQIPPCPPPAEKPIFRRTVDVQASAAQPVHSSRRLLSLSAQISVANTHGFEGSPRSAPMDQLGFVETVDRLQLGRDVPRPPGLSTAVDPVLLHPLVERLSRAANPARNRRDRRPRDGSSPRSPAPFAPRVDAPQARTRSPPRSSWPHHLRRWNLR